MSGCDESIAICKSADLFVMLWKFISNNLNLSLGLWWFILLGDDAAVVSPRWLMDESPVMLCTCTCRLDDKLENEFETKWLIHTVLWYGLECHICYMSMILMCLKVSYIDVDIPIQAVWNHWSHLSHATDFWFQRHALLHVPHGYLIGLGPGLHSIPPIASNNKLHLV